jgi:hypothetical protein
VSPVFYFLKWVNYILFVKIQYLVPQLINNPATQQAIVRLAKYKSKELVKLIAEKLNIKIW